MITLVVSGGQTGADQAGWRAAEACDIPTGGWMPKGFLTEEGPQRTSRISTARRKCLPRGIPLGPSKTFKTATARSGSAPRIRRRQDDARCLRTLQKTPDAGRADRSILPADVVIWLRRNPQIKRLNIAGNRESKNPGIGERVERFLTVVFKHVKARTDP